MFALEHGITKELLDSIQVPFQFQGNIEYMRFIASLRTSRSEDATQAQNTSGVASSVSESQEGPRSGRMARAISDVLGYPHRFPENPFELERYTPAARDFQKLADAADVESGAGPVQDPLRTRNFARPAHLFPHVERVVCRRYTPQAKSGTFPGKLSTHPEHWELDTSRRW